VSETPDEGWERDDCVRRTIVLPTELAERLAAEAEQRGLSVSDLLIEYADTGLQRASAEKLIIELTGCGSR
jgi:Ribbon-helix-helix protein, copG family.